MCGNMVAHSFKYVLITYFLRFTGTIGIGFGVNPSFLDIDTQKYRNGEPYHEDHEEESVTYVTRDIGD